MHAAIASTTNHASRSARRFACSSTILKRPVNARPRKAPAFLQTSANRKDSTLALESLSRLRGSSSERLTWDQIRTILLSSAVPMVGFGFMDNFVMIQAGSYIDSTIGVKFGLATMTAAAMGQVVSDVSGVLFGGTMERVFKVKPASLSIAQQQLAMIPRLRLAGAVFGVIIGCCLGATALLFTPGADAQLQEEQLQQLGGVVHDMLAISDLGASCAMHIVSNGSTTSARAEREGVSVMALSENEGGSSSSSMASRCKAQRGTIVEGNSLCVPVVSSSTDRDVLAVLELKQDDGFSHDDTEEAQRMARHVGIFMSRMLVD
jgi:hypothetical protein